MRRKGGVVNAITPGQWQLPHGVENPPGTVVEATSRRQTFPQNHERFDL